MKKILLLSCITAGIVVMHACKPKKDEVVYSPVNYSFSIPDYAKKYVGDLKQPSDNIATVEGVALGRKLFYEKMLSNDNSMSCATCHKQENAFDDPRPFSKGTNGALGNRNAMTITNLAFSQQFFWDGRRATLEGQAHDPVTNPIEMAAKWPDVVARLQSSGIYPDLFYKAFGTRTIDSNLVTRAISQFERTLLSFTSRFDKYYYQGDSSALNAQEIRGLALFTGKALCNTCHIMNTLFTDHAMRNNGLDNDPADAGLMSFTGLSTDRGKFKVPTLRNIVQTAPYMHDSRFATLEDVVNFYSSGVKQGSPNIDEHMPDFGAGLNLTTSEKEELVAFMRSLTDKDFLTNTAFSDPN